MNHELEGYTVSLPALHLHPLGLSLTLHDLRVTQNAHPDKPVARIPRFDVSVHWHALVHGRLVADVQIANPVIRVDMKNMETEFRDASPLQDKGWQRAVEAIYPLKINHLEVTNGEVSYIDQDPKKPLQLKHLNLMAENIRNVRSADQVYPSELRLNAAVFESGSIRVDGWANFLAEPYAAIYADVALDHIELDALRPVAEHANLRVSKGILSGYGHTEYTPKIRNTQLKQLTIDGVSIDYVHRSETALAEAQHAAKAKEVAKELSNEAATFVQVDELLIHDAHVGYADEDRDPGYKVYLADASIEVRGFTNQATKQPAEVTIGGQFMGKGPTHVGATFMPVNKQPEFDLHLQIDPTPLTAMNELLLSYGKFDVVGGDFVLYSELSAHEGMLHGYIKPLFYDMDVFDRRQDSHKPIFRELYEASVGGVATVLSNSDESVATKADVSGRIDEPNVSTWQLVIRLIGNAFFRAIVPGFENSLKHESAEPAATPRADE